MANSEKSFLRTGIYALLAYSFISISLYFAFYFEKIGSFTILLSSGIVALFFIPLYVEIAILYLSYKKVSNKNDRKVKRL
ncbi:MAG: hypothetical protein OH318_02855 [Candidatus Parvarchaeota archaeon]|nr:hypothetical protein [Candidatus Rehaiarchaeum fermentans]